ncbi:molybdopterin-binding protein [Clostridium sp. CF012]|uniref:molybdopterin-binding protein n=1 Tax=Clostridium sp. CF012 TaxID=2843319 RepID=UPI001C0B1BB0|nr:molybdopterin-binding protein [Clostridium sp. CF012]MBU3142995.1 molybdopterin-binding protein [Clostridium sp. CF012]
MKKIPAREAVGSVLCHDITQIIPGVVKDIAFKKGHIIKEEDIPLLLSIGKENLFVWEKKEGFLHENDAAERLKALTAGVGLTFSEVKEGKINFIADYPGLLVINTNLLYKLNSLGEIILVTLHNNYPVKKGQKVAGTRVIPLVIEEEKIKSAENLIGDDKIVSIIPFKAMKVGIVTTGSEVYHGRIADAFGPVIRRKVEEYGCEVLGQSILADDENMIKGAIEAWIDKGCDMVICTGGMSVDPDDVTPSAILKTGAELITYGAPVLPGAMFLLAYKGDIPILGLPGCVMYSRTTIFDLVLPRILAREKLNYADFAAYGHGGLCNECEECKYPDCAFGKGI